MQDYQLLDWDTETLGINVAKILPANLTAQKLAAVLAELKQQQVQLVYWATDSTDEATQVAAQSCGGFLADEKVTYLMHFAPGHKPVFDSKQIEEYPNTAPNLELEALALESGLYSRFKADPKFGQTKFEKIYKLWIYNSTTRNIAQNVLVTKRDQKIVGMVTLGDKSGRGDIGLLAVDVNYRGLQLGTTLVKAAQAWFMAQGYAESQVVTQKANLAASALYEKCGYHIEKIENFYHFWL